MLLTHFIARTANKARRNREISYGIIAVVCGIILASGIACMPKPSFESRTVVEVVR